MKLHKTEKILLAIALILLMVTGVVYAAQEILRKPLTKEAQADFSFDLPSVTSERKDLVNSEKVNPPEEQALPSGENRPEGSKTDDGAGEKAVPDADPRVGLEPIPKNESDLDRIKRLIAPESPGDINKDYMIRVFKDRQLVTVFEDPKGDGSFDYLIKAFNCSSAREGYETPSGSHKLGIKLYSGFMMDASYGQYCSEFLQYHYLHAVPSYGGVEESGVSWEDYNKLGQAASHGCIRLETKAAKWIYDYCKEGTPVDVLDSSEDFPYLPDRVDQLKMSPDGPAWDPTNPNPENPYQQDPSLLLDYNRQN